MSGLRARLRALRASAGGEAPAAAPARPAPPREAPGEELATPAGALRRVRSVSVPGALHGARRLEELAERWSPDRALGLGRVGALPRPPEELLFVDAETTGLGFGAGTRAFLLGFARLRTDGSVEVEQLWLAEARQEPALLAEAARRLAGAGAWVSFNGRSFDLPLLESRAVLAGARWPERPHLDLLHPARRLLAHGLPDARLGSLEREVLGFRRVGDVDGSEAPAAWFDWLRRGERAGLEAVLRHNLWDLLSLVTLLSALLELVGEERGPERVRHDALALAEHHARGGRRELARRSLHGGEPESEARRALREARLLKRLEGAPAAAGHWRRLLASPEAGPEPWEELAKLLEHREDDPAAAAEVVREALRRHGRRARVRRRLEHRLRRLERKCRAQDPLADGRCSP